MDSINKQQQEDNHEDLMTGEALEKVRELVEKAKSCFMVTKNPMGPSSGVRPMSVQQVDDAGHIWFLSATDSYKNLELSRDPSVQLYFQGSAHSDFMFLSGNAIVSKDKAKIKELWGPILKTWFTEGEDDPRISVIEVMPAEGYYWDTKHGNVIAGIKTMVGAVLGKTMDDSIEGKLRVMNNK